MKRISGTQIVINFIGSNPGCTFSEIRTGTGLDSSVVNSAIWATFNDGRVLRAGERKGYRYTLIDTTAVTESDPSVQYRQRPGGVNPMTNLFNQCLAGVRK
ncbi:helix-turn-helix domain-containing protein [Klebsiella michiganensis]|uniref:MarR family transcriptional regulator n=1 Tax=Klebsiella michiganensis TaxID=1134687 RepID=UPI0032D9B08D